MRVWIWVARDYDGRLFMYKNKPYKGHKIWQGDEYVDLDKTALPEVKWTDKEPTEVEVIIKVKEKSNDSN